MSSFRTSADRFSRTDGLLCLCFLVLVGYYDLFNYLIKDKTVFRTLTELGLLMLGVYYRDVLRRMRVQPVGWMLFGYMLLSCGWSLEPVDSFNVWKRLLFAFVFAAVVSERFDADLRLHLLTAVSVAIITLHYAAIIAFPEESIHWIPRYYGVWRGAVGDRNYMAFHANLTLAVFFAAWRMNVSLFSKILIAAFIVLAMILVVFSKSATGLVCMAILTATMALITLKRHCRGETMVALLMAAALTVFLLIAFFPKFLDVIGRDTTVTGRTDIWRHCWQAWLNRPWFGYGVQNIYLRENQVLLTTYRTGNGIGLFHAMLPHNLYLGMLVKYGVFGFGLFLLFLASSLKTALVSAERPDQGMGEWPLFCFIVIGVFGLTLTLDHLPFIWLLFGLIFFASDRDESSRSGEPPQQEVKRWFDVAVASIMLLLASPVMAVIAIILTASGRSPLYRQLRTGLHGKPFMIYKFRTLAETSDEESVPSYVEGSDMRISQFCRFLRKTGLDELPQLLNVIKGEMSLVGPRPQPLNHLPYYEQHISDYAKRHAMRPGMTGLVQLSNLRHISGRMEDVAKRLRYDLYYINHWSFCGDIGILLKTLTLPFKQRPTVQRKDRSAGAG